MSKNKNALKQTLLAASLIASMTSGCSSNKADSGSQSVVNSSIKQIDSAMEKAALLANPNVSAYRSSSSKDLMFAILFGVTQAKATAFQGLWDQSYINGLDWNMVSPKEYLKQALNSDFKNPNNANTTAFGRLKNTTRMICAFDTLIPAKDANGLPANGTYDLQVDLSPNGPLAQNCSGFENEENKVKEIQVKVSTPDDSSVYMKKFTIMIDGRESQMVGYITVNDGFIRIAGAEDQSPERDDKSRTLLEFDRTADVLKFEYLSQGFDVNSGVELERILIDNRAEKAYIMMHQGSFVAQAQPEHYVQFIAAGTPVDANRTQIAVSFGYKGQANQPDLANLNACVDVNTESIAADDTLNCQVNGLNVSDASAITDSFVKHVSSADITIDDLMKVPFNDVAEFLGKATH